MYILYHDYGGTHSAIVAANMHLNQLPMDHVPDKDTIRSLPLYDQLTPNDHGRIINMGTDEYGNTVSIIGVENKENMVIPAIKDMYFELRKTLEDFLEIDTSSSVNVTMKIGGFISRSLRIPAVGQPLVLYGTQEAYMDIAQIVKNAKTVEQSYVLK